LFFGDKIVIENFDKMDFRASIFLPIPKAQWSYTLIEQIRKHIKDYFLQTYNYDVGQISKIDLLAVNQEAEEIHFWLVIELDNEHKEKILPLIKAVDIFKTNFPVITATKFFPEKIWRYFIEKYKTIQDFSIAPKDRDLIKLFNKKNGTIVSCPACGKVIWRVDENDYVICNQDGCGHYLMPIVPKRYGYKWQLNLY